jgi:hypothetical protein
MNKNKRVIYVLRDSVEGKFYTSRSITLGEFDHAIIHTTLASVTSGLKDRVRGWKNRAQSVAEHSTPDKIHGPWGYFPENPKCEQEGRELWARYVREFQMRKDVKNYGIEIVAITVETP